QKNSGQVVWSPLAQGLLSGKYSGAKVPKGSRIASDRMNMFIKDQINDKELLAKIDRFKDLAESLGHKASQLALAWCLRKSIITSAITCASKPAQVTENARAADIDFTPELEAKVKEGFAYLHLAVLGEP